MSRAKGIARRRTGSEGESLIEHFARCKQALELEQLTHDFGRAWFRFCQVQDPEDSCRRLSHRRGLAAERVLLDYGAAYPLASLGRYVNVGGRLPNLLEDALRQGNAA